MFDGSPELTDSKIETGHRLPGVFCDVFELTSEEVVDLKERVDKWNGVIRVFVHPFFIEHGYAKQTHHHFPNQERTGNVLKRLVSKHESKTPPILILQESESIDKAGKELEKSSQRVLIVQTVENDPDLDHGRSFDDLKEFLKKIGVKRVLVGGQFLFIDAEEVDNNDGTLVIPERYGYEDMEPWLGGCTGKAINGIRDPNYTIEISHTSYPDNITKLRGVLE